MRYLRFVADSPDKKENYGIIEGDFVYLIDKPPLAGNPEKTGTRIHINDIKSFLPPVEPPSIIAIGLNYAKHAQETNAVLPDAPLIFLKSVTSLTGHMQKIKLPAEAPDSVDYEAELTVIIGKRAKNIPVEKVREYILGYTCGNDVSARDCQANDKQWSRAKSFDTFAPVGPFVATDINPENLQIQSRVNGKVMQDSRTSDMIFSVYRIVSYLSRQMTLLPGTIIMTGTPSGVGLSRNPQVFLKEGDEVEVEIEHIGILKNTVSRE